MPRGAQCGELSVPVDYSQPDQDVATLALIRIPATGNRIGSLVINPGGPGESGVDAAVGMVNGWQAFCAVKCSGRIRALGHQLR